MWSSTIHAKKRLNFIDGQRIACDMSLLKKGFWLVSSVEKTNILRTLKPKVIRCASNVFAHVEYIVVTFSNAKASGFSGLGLAVGYVALSLSEIMMRASMSVP